jgi:integrase
MWATYIKDLGERRTAVTMGSTSKAVLTHFGAYRPEQIDRDLCRAYADIRIGNGLKQGTVHAELGHLRSTMRFAVKIGLIEKAPDIWRPVKPAPKDRFLTRPEITRLMDADSAPHIALAIHMMLSTAGRVGAILDLTWDRVDFERGQINLRLPESQNRKGRAIVPINAGLSAALQTAEHAALSDYVIEYAGKQVKSIRKGMVSAFLRANIKGATIHTLRHTAAVEMVSNGVSLERVGQFLGHSKIAVTYFVYARFAPDHLRDAADILDFVAIRSMK